jgi:type I restriction enzyme S subunit
MSDSATKSPPGGPRRFEPYPAYRDSGVEWLGKIPAGWDVRRLKEVAAIQNGADHKHIEVHEGYPVIGSGGPFAFASDFMYDGESVLLGRKGTVDRPLYVNGRFWTVDTMYWTRITKGASARFVYYAALTIPFDYYSTNTALPSMTQSALSNHAVAIPALSEQRAIATFLDRETARIDALVAKKERLITLLQERRTALITHAVTKGLDPAAPMKDSGVEWLGEIPAHWEVLPLKRLFEKLDYRRRPLSSEERATMSKDFDYYGASGIIDRVENYIFDEDLILVAEDGANLFSRSTPLAFVARGNYWVNNHAHILRPRDNKLGYWERVLSSVVFDPWISGSAQPKLTSDSLGSIPLPVPPPEERDDLLNRLSPLLEETDRLQMAFSTAITYLHELRTALISAAVTGKIDVREAAQ